MKTAAERTGDYRASAISMMFAVSLFLPMSASLGQTKSTETAPPPAPRLTGTTVTLPIVMVREFPFIEGEVAGVKGKFMLDTGMQNALVINDHLVPLNGGTRIGTGFFGSGQTFDIRLHEVVDDIRIGDLRIPQAVRVRSQDARMLETITPDFLGWVGYDFFTGYALKMDYRRLRATFYKAGSRQYLRGEEVVEVVRYVCTGSRLG